MWKKTSLCSDPFCGPSFSLLPPGTLHLKRSRKMQKKQKKGKRVNHLTDLANPPDRSVSLLFPFHALFLLLQSSHPQTPGDGNFETLIWKLEKMLKASHFFVHPPLPLPRLRTLDHCLLKPCVFSSFWFPPGGLLSATLPSAPFSCFSSPLFLPPLLPTLRLPAPRPTGRSSVSSTHVASLSLHHLLLLLLLPLLRFPLVPHPPTRQIRPHPLRRTPPTRHTHPPQRKYDQPPPRQPPRISGVEERGSRLPPQPPFQLPLRLFQPHLPASASSTPYLPRPPHPHHVPPLLRPLPAASLPSSPDRRPLGGMQAGVCRTF
mmetsp:Transcript_12180/g.23571  ORF Transcript_12180/g.23571 Transcript_12180/m.23571 type:complete len:318 (-) Transcript_12180:795-1748(-)